MNNNALEFNDVPDWWALCFQTDCPLAGHCLRHHVGTLAPATLTRATCVTPHARLGEQCRQFATREPRQWARGFERGFQKLKSRDARYELRLELTRYFGSVGSFYNYRQGRRVMGVLKRQHVIEVFARWGVGEDDVLDEQWTGYYFDHGEELDDYPGRSR